MVKFKYDLDKRYWYVYSIKTKIISEEHSKCKSFKSLKDNKSLYSKINICCMIYCGKKDLISLHITLIQNILLNNHWKGELKCSKVLNERETLNHN